MFTYIYICYGKNLKVTAVNKIQKFTVGMIPLNFGDEHDNLKATTAKLWTSKHKISRGTRCTVGLWAMPFLINSHD